jgi:hypothetical protein
MRARRAVDRDKHEQARGLARELLELAQQYQDDWNYGNAVHHAHLILGRVALAERDLTGARSELLLAGQTPGSPQLNSFGPNMILARDLFRAGERDVVLDYLQLCRTFWEMGSDQLDTWTSDISQGQGHDLARISCTEGVGLKGLPNELLERPGIGSCAHVVPASPGRSAPSR